MSVERERLDDPAWKAWGPYVSERAWGSVREDYSADGSAWEYLPHDHARSRACRWSEDGLAGVCDQGQTWCLALALWNGSDPILKERMFGLSGPEGNHGEDVKEYWWYVDSTPTHSWLRWRYHYPQAEFPYAQLVEENARRSKTEPEFELVDSGVFNENRFWAVTVDYAKAAPTELVMRITVENKGPEPATLHVLPTLWLRNTWTWRGVQPPHTIRAAGPGRLDADVVQLSYPGQPELLFCDNETNSERLFGVPSATRFPKDGINDRVIHGAETVNPAATGTKAALHYEVTVPAGGAQTITLGCFAGEQTSTDLDAVLAAREQEADAFYADVLPGLDEQAAAIARQAFAGMLWGKQFYHYDVERWLDGDPAEPPPPPQRQSGRNSGWRHLNNHDVISMPDKWEYPWYAAWDLAFHCVALAHVDPTFAKDQLVLLLREWYMHPGGQLPAYEWSFSDVNPPVHAWAALQVFEIDGAQDYHFLERIFHKLLLNFTWWVNRKDSEGNNLFEGGFLGMDNIGPFDRSATPPTAGELEQSDGTAWMAMYCLNMLEIALVLATNDEAYEDMATKFFEHFAYIASAAQQLWDDGDGFFYDVLKTNDGQRVPLRARSMVGLLPLCATTTLGEDTLQRLPNFAARMRWFLANKPEYAGVVAATHVRDGRVGRLLAVVEPDRLGRVLARLLDESEFLSPYGIRALSAVHRDAPFVLRLDGFQASVDYEPGESTSGLFGGNSNWRGPIWFPVNFLLIEAIGRFARYFGDDYTVDGRTLGQVAQEISDRLAALFRPDANGRRPVYGHYEQLSAPDWRDFIPFHEYFHGDTGAGLGASHQTGWTGLIADLLIRRCAGDAPSA